jgi:hypothetical protein
MLLWVFVLSFLLYLLVVRHGQRKQLTYSNGLFYTLVNSVPAVVDTGSIHTVVHEFHSNQTYDYTIAYGSQTSSVFFEERYVECASKSKHIVVGIALPQRPHVNLLGLAKGNTWAASVLFNFPKLTMVFDPEPLPVNLHWISPPQLPGHTYILPLQATNVANTSCKYIVIDTGSNLTSVPKDDYFSFLLATRSHQALTFTIEGITYTFPSTLYRWTNGSLLFQGDSPLKHTIVIGSFFLRTSRLYLNSSGCCWDMA